MKRSRLLWALSILLALALVVTTDAWAQNTATLSGVVKDPNGGSVAGIKVTLVNKSTGVERSAITGEEGRYEFVSLPPGTYKITIDAGSGFELYERDDLEVNVGAQAEFSPKLSLHGVSTTERVVAEPNVIEPTQTENSNTIGQRLINDLPIDGRDYKTFARTDSRVVRPDSPTIGPAPDSGLSVAGSRGRANGVTVDGADAVDNSINGIRATLSQEGVQEFQVIMSNYNAEYGRATGGVINIITKSGGNELHGDLFGFFRNKSFQARNPFSGQIDTTPGSLTNGELVPVKQPYTRVQTGMTIGGPIRKNKTFFFGSYEYTQREETGFSSIGIDNFGLVDATTQFVPGVKLRITPPQDAAVQQLLAESVATANPALAQLAAQYEVFMGSASSVALNGLDYGLVATALGLPTAPGPQFPIPVQCAPGQPVNNSNGSAIPPTCSLAGFYVAPLPTSYVGLASIRGNYPVKEKTSLWSMKLDQIWNSNNQSFVRVGVSPSLVTGLPSTSQNQVFGQNSGSRAGYNQSRDLNVTFQHDTIVDKSTTNTFRFQFARRGLHFGFSQQPGGDQIGVNIPGIAYFGREPYSTVDRIERRYQFSDNLAKVAGNHTFKFGVDGNLIQLRSSKAQIFELDFGGDVNFGSISASNFNQAFAGLPDASDLQAYGLGFPTTYIQGIGNSNQPFDNLPFGFFAQDSWRINRKLTLNYGVRYDVEITPLFAPATQINKDAEQQLHVVEGIPRDYNNVAPRVGLAWDLAGNGKTLVRMGYGLFYDHPLLAVAFNAVTADGGRSVQLLSGPGAASACGLLPSSVLPVCGGTADSPANLNGSSIFQGVLNAGSADLVFSPLTLGYLPSQQRFDPLAPNSLFAGQQYLSHGFPLPILPFTLPVASNFKFGYAQQANLTVERELAKDLKVSVGYQYTKGIHLNRPVDVNSTDPVLLANNLLDAVAAGFQPASPLSVVAPSSPVPAGLANCGVTVIAPAVLGMLNNCPAPFTNLTGKFIGTPAFFNFFRPSGPNPSFAASAGGYDQEVFFAGLAHYPTGFGVPVPFNSVDTQLSDASSWYHALTVNVQKRFSKGFEFLSSYTWSHSIDDGTDLQSTLEPQDSRFPFFERANSVNDQRHRWVTSGVFQSWTAGHGDGAFKHVFGGITLAPILELSSGRPFNVITGRDTRLDLAASEARPSVAASGGTTDPFIPGVHFVPADQCLAADLSTFQVLGISPPAGCNGNLGRNRFVTPKFIQFDLRVSKEIPIGERLRFNLIADGFNLFNHTNIAAVNQLCEPSNAPDSTCTAGQPTAAYDARLFQFALKLYF